MDSRHRHDQASNDHQIGRPGIVVMRLLLGVEGEAEIPVSKVFGLGKSRAENIGDNGRLYEHDAHDCCLPAGVVDFVAGKASMHASGQTTSYKSRQYDHSQQSRDQDGERTVNPSMSPARKRLAQIADQGSSHGIRQHQPRHDAMFILVRDPSNQTHFAVNSLDVDALAEGVEDNRRLYQRRVFVFIGHLNIPLSTTNKGESDAKSAHDRFHYSNLIVGRRLGVNAGQQPQQEAMNDHAPRESAAVEISHLIPHSLPGTPSTATDSPAAVSSLPSGSQISGAA
ncbi:hypothetical protein FJ973_29765 [Mesorhizobium sp. B2-1-3]|nr:hypothetical protein FJ973_29765 [Mesorhizobium sp. B2-1-3]